MNAEPFLNYGVLHLYPCPLWSFLEEITPYVLQSALGIFIHYALYVQVLEGVLRKLISSLSQQDDHKVCVCLVCLCVCAKASFCACSCELV
jgi:hypothetical protein